MEEDLDSETHRRLSPPVVGNTGCNYQLTRSNSDASSLTAENCKDSFRRKQNVMPEKCPAWTNEKHNLYLYDLEMSFVKQLYQSKSVLAHCSGHNVRAINRSPKRTINLKNASEQYDVLQNGDLRNGRWQNINCAEEGTGQNFLDEQNQTTQNFDSQKRLKIALGDASHQDQIAPSKGCHTPNHSVINSSTCGE